MKNYFISIYICILSLNICVVCNISAYLVLSDQQYNNIYAAVFADIGHIGIGEIIRDHEGNIVAAISLKLQGPLNKKLHDVRAAVIAINFAIETGFQIGSYRR